MATPTVHEGVEEKQCKLQRLIQTDLCWNKAGHMDSCLLFVWQMRNRHLEPGPTSKQEVYAR